MFNFTSLVCSRTSIGKGLLLATLATGCSDAVGGPATGQLRVLIEPESTITDGLDPGDSGARIRDGWQVRFQQYLVTIGDVDLHFLAEDESTEVLHRGLVVDLAQIPERGFMLWEGADLATGQWEFHYSTPKANEKTKAHTSVSDSALEEMQDNGWTYQIQATLSKQGGASCPPLSLVKPGEREANGSRSGNNPCYDSEELTLDFGMAADTAYGPCEVDGKTGFSVAESSTSTVAISIHGDHLFFNGFPEGGEGGSLRLAQWLADCDLNLDGTITLDELSEVDPALLPEIDDRYQLGGSPITPLHNMADYVRAQLKTQGHFEGEGECPLDGKSHEH